MESLKCWRSMWISPFCATGMKIDTVIWKLTGFFVRFLGYANSISTLNPFWVAPVSYEVSIAVPDMKVLMFLERFHSPHQQKTLEKNLPLRLNHVTFVWVQKKKIFDVFVLQSQSTINQRQKQSALFDLIMHWALKSMPNTRKLIHHILISCFSRNYLRSTQNTSSKNSSFNEEKPQALRNLRRKICCEVPRKFYSRWTRAKISGKIFVNTENYSTILS